MNAQKQRFPSIAATISALGIILYCVGFLRVELELKNQRERLQALENIPETEPPSSDRNIAKFIKVARGMYFQRVLILFWISCRLKSFFPSFWEHFRVRNCARHYHQRWSKSVKEYDRDDFLCLSKANQLSRSFSGYPNTVQLFSYK